LLHCFDNSEQTIASSQRSSGWFSGYLEWRATPGVELAHLGIVEPWGKTM